MIQRILLVLTVILVLIAVFTFTARNSGDIELDLVFGVVSPSVPIAFVVTLAIGWLFGVLSMGLFAIRLLRQRRALKRSLKASESEVSTLRSLPLSDAE